MHQGHELKIHILFPHLKCSDKQVIDAGDGGCLQQQLGLRTAFLSRDQHFGDGGRLGIREQAVHLAHEVPPQRNQEENAETSACQTDEDGLHRAWIEVEDIQRGKGENGAGNHPAGRAADSRDDDILKQTRAALVNAGQSDGKDGDGDCRLHDLPDLQPRVRRCNGENHAKHHAPNDRSQREFRLFRVRGHNGSVGFPWLQRLVGVFRK